MMLPSVDFYMIQPKSTNSMQQWDANMLATIFSEHHFITEISSWSASFACIHIPFLSLVWKLNGVGSNKIGLFGWRLLLGSFGHSRNIYWAPTVARHYARYDNKKVRLLSSLPSQSLQSHVIFRRQDVDLILY